MYYRRKDSSLWFVFMEVFWRHWSFKCQEISLTELRPQMHSGDLLTYSSLNRLLNSISESSFKQHSIMFLKRPTDGRTLLWRWTTRSACPLHYAHSFTCSLTSLTPSFTPSLVEQWMIGWIFILFFSILDQCAMIIQLHSQTIIYFLESYSVEGINASLKAEIEKILAELAKNVEDFKDKEDKIDSEENPQPHWQARAGGLANGRTDGYTFL